MKYTAVMEAQDFEMPSPKRQRTDSPMEVSAPLESLSATEKVPASTEVQDSKQEQQVPDMLDFLMQHVESESKSQEAVQNSNVARVTHDKAESASSAAVATDAVPLPMPDQPDAESVLNGQRAIGENVDRDVSTQKAVIQNVSAPSEPSTEPSATTVQQSTDPAAAAPDSVMTTEREPPVEAREWETDSSPYSSDSSDTTDSSDDDSDEDDDDADPYVLLDPMEQARILMAEDGGGGGDSDDEGTQTRATKAPTGIRTINEKPETILPKPDVVVTSSTPIEELGSVTFFVENTLLITAKTSGEYQVLESGSVLCLGAPTYAVIGAVAETLGRVEEPLYTVRFASETDVRETFGLNTPALPEKEGTETEEGQVSQDPQSNAPQADLATILKKTPIFYVKSHSTFVFTQPLRSAKGTDASNIHDEEVGEDEQEFSDDEAEAEYKRVQKLKKKGIDPGTVPPPGSRGRGGHRGGRGQRGGSSYGNTTYDTQQDAVMNYDDVEEGETGSIDYTPLRRPDTFQQPQQDSQQSNDYQQNRGRGRGGRGNFNSRGRGGRGRGNYQNQNQSQPQRSTYNDVQTYNNTAYNTNMYNQPASMYPTFQPQMPTMDFSFQAQAQSHWAQYHANQNQQYQQQQQQQYGGQPSMPGFNAEALAQVQRQLEEMRRQGQGYQ